MYRCLYDSFSKLTEKDKNEPYTKADKRDFHEVQIRFPGFDGNNEIEQLAYTKFLFSTKWGELHDKKQDLDAHCPMLAKYRKMLSGYKTFQKDNSYRLLNQGELKEILSS